MPRPTKRLESDQFGKSIYAKTADPDRKVIERVSEVAKARRVPQAQVALAWVLTKPAITSPIVGATKPNHLGRRGRSSRTEADAGRGEGTGRTVRAARRDRAQLRTG